MSHDVRNNRSSLYWVWWFSFVNRESLLGQLIVHQKSLHQNFTDASGGKAPKGKNLPEFVNNIVYVRQIEAKVNIQSLYIINDQVLQAKISQHILCMTCLKLSRTDTTFWWMESVKIGNSSGKKIEVYLRFMVYVSRLSILLEVNNVKFIYFVSLTLTLLNQK